MLDHALRQSEAARDFNSAGCAGDANKQAIGRPQVHLIELHGGVDDAGSAGGVGLQAVVVRGGERQRAAASELLEQSDGERGSLFGRGAGAHFIDQNQRAISGALEHRFEVQHVRGKRGQVRGDRLLIADIGEYAIEDRQLGALGGHRNRGLRRERGEADGFERDGFATSVRPADDQHGFIAAERESRRNSLASLRAQRGFEDGVAGCVEPERIAHGKFGNGTIEFAGEAGASENRIEMRDVRGCCLQRAAFGADAVSQLREDVRNFDGFFLAELDEAIVEVDGIERLDENGLAGGAGGVDDAGHLAAVAGANGDDEAVVTQRDVVFAYRLAAGAEDFLERLTDRRPRLDFSGANAPEVRRSIVADFTVGQYSATDGREQ